jgi:hypothetical protein
MTEPVFLLRSARMSTMDVRMAVVHVDATSRAASPEG